jgi:putative PIG3 family NAD(P)H quinone oxidoreductase
MQAITVPSPGGPEVLTITEVAEPDLGAHEVIIDVVAAGINRADISQRQGSYPSPAGSPPWPGLEVSGTILERGADVTSFEVGDRVCALLGGGGYAERVAVTAAQVLPVPTTIDLVDAAGLIEVIATVWSNIFQLAKLQSGELLLVHGGSSGIGTMAVQLGKAFGARVAVTASSAQKLEACAALGADVLINYRDDDFVARIKEEGGADVILDVVGGSYLERNVRSLRHSGRIANIANLSGETGTLNFGALMMKRATITSTTLRSRTPAEKADVIASVRKHVWPLVQSGAVRPVIAARFPFAEAAQAHRLIESSAHIGKVLLTR